MPKPQTKRLFQEGQFVRLVDNSRTAPVPGFGLHDRRRPGKQIPIGTSGEIRAYGWDFGIGIHQIISDEWQYVVKFQGHRGNRLVLEKEILVEPFC
jgi:hypothetical protein